MEASVVLGGLTTATFGASERTAFKQGVSAVLAVSVDQVDITDVRDIQKSRRRALLQGGESADTQLQVTFRVSGFESEAEASSVSQRISTAADQAAGGDGSLATELIRNGLPSNIIVSVAQPSIIVFQSQNGTGGGSNNNLLAIVLGKCR